MAIDKKMGQPLSEVAIKKQSLRFDPRFTPQIICFEDN